MEKDGKREKYLAQCKKMVYGGSVSFKSYWIYIENHILSQKLEKEDYDCYDMWKGRKKVLWKAKKEMVAQC
jgi:hypothetical protein